LHFGGHGLEGGEVVGVGTVKENDGLGIDEGAAVNVVLHEIAILKVGRSGFVKFGDGGSTITTTLADPKKNEFQRGDEESDLFNALFDVRIVEVTDRKAISGLGRQAEVTEKDIFSHPGRPLRIGRGLPPPTGLPSGI